jgi:NTP pyrophosphatase (non-canonical NTP hydrolase)
MTLEEYQALAMRTHNASDGVLANYALGLGGEVGEVLEPIKKHLFHGRPLDRAHVAKELGDVLWYVAALAHVLDLSIGDVAEANIAKLRERWPEGFGVASTVR